MVLTRSQYKNLGEVLSSLGEVQKIRREKMSEADNSARLDAMEKQIETIGTTLTQLVGLINGGDKKEESSLKDKKKLVESDEEREKSYSEEEAEVVKSASHTGGKNYYQNLKINFKVEIPVYDGSVNVEKLDD